jgi:hypothetical protein
LYDFFVRRCLLQAASIYITETTGTVGTSATFEIEYTVDTSQHTWATADTLTLLVPDNFVLPSLSFTAEYDSDVNNDGVGETAISPGLGNGQSVVSSGNLITIKWHTGLWGAVVNNASTIRILLTANPSFENTSSTFTFGGSTANGADLAISGSDLVNVAAADAAASVLLTGNQVVAVRGNLVLSLNLPVRLTLNDTVVFTLPSNLILGDIVFLSETFLGAGSFSSCTALAQTVTCTADGIIRPARNVVWGGFKICFYGETVTALASTITIKAG